MSTPARRADIIAHAEKLKGSVLPPKMRAALIEDGFYECRLPEAGPSEIYLTDTPEGTSIFEEDSGYLFKDRGGWDCWEKNVHLADGAFLLAENGLGDDFLLSPDADGIARRLVFANHEIGVLSVLYEDIDDPRSKRLAMPLYEPEEEEEDTGATRDAVPEPEVEYRPPPLPLGQQTFNPAFVFALGAAGIVTVVSMFVGVFLAYRWRRSDPENAGKYTRAIRLFWTAAMGWAVALVLLAIAVVLAKTDNGGLVLFKAAVLIAFGTQILFTLVSLYHSFRLSWGVLLRRALA